MHEAARTERRTRTPQWSGAPFSHLEDAEVRAEFMAYGYESAIDEPVTLVFMPREAEQLCLWLRTQRKAERQEYNQLMRAGAAVEAGIYWMRDTFIPFAEFEAAALEDLAATRDTAQ